MFSWNSSKARPRLWPGRRNPWFSAVAVEHATCIKFSPGCVPMCTSGASSALIYHLLLLGDAASTTFKAHILFKIAVARALHENSILMSCICVTFPLRAVNSGHLTHLTLTHRWHSAGSTAVVCSCGIAYQVNEGNITSIYR